MQVFSVTRLLVSRVPATRLARLGEAATLQEALKYCDGYHAARNEFFFNTRNRNFPDILEFYRTGSLHISENRC